VEAGFDAGTVDRRHRALYLLKELGLSGDENPASLSGGEARRAALARARAPPQASGPPRRDRDGSARSGAADLSGRLVVAAETISKAYGDHIIVRNFSIRIMRGDRVGIVGRTAPERPLYSTC